MKTKKYAFLEMRNIIGGSNTHIPGTAINDDNYKHPIKSILASKVSMFKIYCIWFLFFRIVISLWSLTRHSLEWWHIECAREFVVLMHYEISEKLFNCVSFKIFGKLFWFVLFATHTLFLSLTTHEILHLICLKLTRFPQFLYLRLN